MANNSARVIKLTVMVNGQRQVLKTLEDYQTHMKRLAVHMNDLDKQIKKAGNNPALLQRLQAERNALAAEIKDMKDYVKALKQAQTDINSIAAKVKSKQSLADVKSDNRNAKQVASRLDPGNKQQAKELEKINKIIGEQNYKIREQEKAMKAVVMPAKELGKVLGNLKSSPLDQLKNAEAELVRQLSQATRGTEEFARTNSRLQSVRQQIKETGESMKGVAMSTTQLNNTMRNLSTAPMQKLKTAEEQLKRAIADGNLTEKQREKTLKNLSSVQREITKREQEAAAATKKGAQAAKDASIGYKGYQKTLTDQKATMEQLKRAAQELKEKMEKSAPNSLQYQQYAKSLQQVNDKIKQGTEQHTKHASAISNAMSRLKTYVMIYMGFNKLLDVMRNFVNQSMQLSDSIADIQKVTKTSAYEVDMMSDALLRLDTRSSTEALHKLAYSAGMLGLKSKEDIVGFVKEADQMTWALKEMGENGAVQLMKVATATGDVAKYGVDGALRKLGSAINEITANSAASAGPVTEIVSRLSAMGSMSKYASSELVAIGSTLSALNIPAERGATSVTRIMMSMSTKLSSIAAHAGLTSTALRELKRETDEAYNRGESNVTGSMAMLIKVLEALREKTKDSANPIAELEPIFKDMGKQSTRLAETLGQLVNNVDMVKEHVGITSQAFEEGVSMMNEYNVKNETAAALLARIGNNIREYFVNSSLVRGVENVLRVVLKATEGVGFLHRAFVVIKDSAIAYGFVYIVRHLGYIKTLAIEAAFAINGLAKRYVAWTLGVTMDTLAEQQNTASVVGNTNARYVNAGATTAQSGASALQTSSNEMESVSWVTLTGAMQNATRARMIWTTVAGGAMFIAVAASVLYLAGAFDTLTDAERNAAEARKKMADAAAEVESSIELEALQAADMFSKAITLREEIDELEKSVVKLGGTIQEETEVTYENIEATENFLYAKKQETESSKESTEATKDNSAAKSENVSATDSLSNSSVKLQGSVDSAKKSTDLESSSISENSDEKYVNKEKSEELTTAENKLKNKKLELHSVSMQLQRAFPQTLSDMNIEEAKVADLYNAYSRLNGQLQNRLLLMGQEAQMEAAKQNYLDTQKNMFSVSDESLRRLAENSGMRRENIGNFMVEAKALISGAVIKAGNGNGKGKNGMTSLQEQQLAVMTGISSALKKYGGTSGNSWASVDIKHGNTFGDDLRYVQDNVLNLMGVTANAYDTFIQQQALVEDAKRKAIPNYDKMTPTQRQYAIAKLKGVDVNQGGINTNYIVGPFGPEAGVVDVNSDNQDELIRWHKELDSTMNMPFGSEERSIKFYELTGQIEPSDAKQSQQVLQQMSTKIKDRLKQDFKVSDSGKALHTPKGRTKHEPKGRKKITVDGKSMFVDDIKSDQTAALSALRGYYETRKQKVKEDYIANRITTQAKDSMLSQLEMDYKFDLAELYKKLLGEESKFQQTKYGKWFEGKNLEQLSKFLLKMGKSEKEGGTGDSALIDGMRANGEKAYNDALDVIIKHMDSLHKIFLQYDYTGSINEAYQKKLEEVDLFWGAYQERMGKNAQETAELQIRNFKELAEQSLGWNASDLRKKMESMKKFNDWFKGKDDTTKFFVGYDDKGNKIMRTQLENDLEGLLIILQNYRHELIDAQKKVGDEGHKRALEIAETAIETQTHIVKTQEANEALLKSLQSEGYVKSSTVDRYEIEHIKQRIEYQKRLIQLIQLEKGDTKKEFEVLTSLKEKLIEKNEEIQRSIRENVKAYVDVFNEMTSALTTAGNEHASLTALAEIAAKRRLGIAVDTTKKEYMIYSRNGKAVRKMMTEEEKLTWDMQNDARNQQLDALVKWLHDWGQKIAEDMTNALSSQVALEQQKEHEQKMLEQADEEARGERTIAREKSESIQQLEDLITSNFRSNIDTRLAEAAREMAERVKLTEDAVERINALNMGVNNDSYVSDFANVKTQAVDAYAFSEAERSEANRNGIKVSPYTWDKIIMERNSELFYNYELDDAIGLMARNMLDNLGAIYEANAHTQEVRDMLSRFEKYNSRDVANLEFDELDNFLRWLAETDKYGSNVYTAAYSKWSKMVTKDPSIENRKTYTDEDFRAAMQNGSDIGITKDGHYLVEAEAVGYRKNKTSVVEEHKEAKQEMLNTEIETNKAMTDSHKRMVLSMISAMNMYGIAYNAVMNDSLSVSQRVGLATLQSFGQVAMSMMSVLMSDTIASIGADEAKGIAKIWGKTPNPAIALPLIAIMTGALGAAMGLATKKITKSKSEIAAVTGAASGKKVAAGMLTYAEGNYPVLGSDGEVYDAKRETNWKTKVYSSPHYGILGEKGPELIVDGVTTRKMMTLRPDLYQDILDLARGRQAVRAKAYAEGNYPAMPAANASGTVSGDTNAMLVAAISQLNAQLAGGIKVAALGEDGAVRRLNEAEDWMRKHGLA